MKNIGITIFAASVLIGGLIALSKRNTSSSYRENAEEEFALTTVLDKEMSHKDREDIFLKLVIRTGAHPKDPFSKGRGNLDLAWESGEVNRAEARSILESEKAFKFVENNSDKAEYTFAMGRIAYYLGDLETADHYWQLAVKSGSSSAKYYQAKTNLLDGIYENESGKLITAQETPRLKMRKLKLLLEASRSFSPAGELARKIEKEIILEIDRVSADPNDEEVPRSSPTVTDEAMAWIEPSEQQEVYMAYKGFAEQRSDQPRLMAGMGRIAVRMEKWKDARELMLNAEALGSATAAWNLGNRVELEKNEERRREYLRRASELRYAKASIAVQKQKIDLNDFAGHHHIKDLIEDSVPQPQIGSSDSYDRLRYMTAFVNEFEGESLFFMMQEVAKWPPKFVMGGAAARGEAKMKLGAGRFTRTVANFEESFSRYKNKKNLFQLFQLIAGDHLGAGGDRTSLINKPNEIKERLLRIIDRQGLMDAKKLCIHYYGDNELLVKLMYQRAVKYIESFPGGTE